MQHHVLVVDDEPDIRELLDLTLTRMGLQVTTAEDLRVSKTRAGETKLQFLPDRYASAGWQRPGSGP